MVKAPFHRRPGLPSLAVCPTNVKSIMGAIVLLFLIPTLERDYIISDLAAVASSKHKTAATKSAMGQEVKTENEKFYSDQYQKWQLGPNKFGANYKKRYWRDYISSTTENCLEFGSSSGHILKSMPCRNLVGVEINDAARAYAQNELGLRVLLRSSELPENSQDFVFSSSVLEHVECPVCEFRELFRLLKPGGVISVTVPGMAPRSMQWKENDINFEFQMFGALELGNLLTAVGFLVDPQVCFSEVTEWPRDYEAIFQKEGLDKFIETAKIWGASHKKLVTTWCVARKPTL